MSGRRIELLVLLCAAVAIAVVILVTLHVLDQRGDPNAGVEGRQEVGTPADELRGSGGPPLPDRGSHPVPSPG
jgi:hypothetical protein